MCMVNQLGMLIIIYIVGWQDITTCDHQLFLARTEVISDFPVVTMSIKIEKNYTFLANKDNVEEQMKIPMLKTSSKIHRHCEWSMAYVGM